MPSEKSELNKIIVRNAARRLEQHSCSKKSRSVFLSSLIRNEEKEQITLEEDFPSFVKADTYTLSATICVSLLNNQAV